MLGFVEDIRKVVVSARQELIMIRSNSDSKTVVGEDKGYNVGQYILEAVTHLSRFTQRTVANLIH